MRVIRDAVASVLPPTRRQAMSIRSHLVRSAAMILFGLSGCTPFFELDYVSRINDRGFIAIEDSTPLKAGDIIGIREVRPNEDGGKKTSFVNICGTETYFADIKVARSVSGFELFSFPFSYMVSTKNLSVANQVAQRLKSLSNKFISPGALSGVRVSLINSEEQAIGESYIESGQIWERLVSQPACGPALLGSVAREQKVCVVRSTLVSDVTYHINWSPTVPQKDRRAALDLLEFELTKGTGDIGKSPFNEEDRIILRNTTIGFIPYCLESS